MNMQVTTKLARLASRLEAVGRRHRELDDEIAQAERRPLPDQLTVRQLKREKLRLKDEIQNCEGLLRTLSRGQPKTTRQTAR